MDSTKLFAIGDLHLPGDKGKAMDIFGAAWGNHFEKITRDWQSRVGDDDIVILPGDFSWSQDIKGAICDINRVGELPGYKVLIRGNHDYWWSSITKVRAVLPPKMFALQNDSMSLGGVTLCGSRGWSYPDVSHETFEEDKKIYAREIIRLRLSLENAALSMKTKPNRRLVLITHFPPITKNLRNTEVSRLAEEFGVNDVVYGHLHDEGIAQGISGVQNGVRYHLASCDALGFRLLEL